LGGEGAKKTATNKPKFHAHKALLFTTPKSKAAKNVCGLVFQCSDFFFRHKRNKWQKRQKGEGELTILFPIVKRFVEFIVNLNNAANCVFSLLSLPALNDRRSEKVIDFSLTFSTTSSMFSDGCIFLKQT
jgi:hypothetical protein